MARISRKGNEFLVKPVGDVVICGDVCAGGFSISALRRKRIILREPQHTPGAYPRHPQTPK